MVHQLLVEYRKQNDRQPTKNLSVVRLNVLNYQNVVLFVLYINCLFIIFIFYSRVCRKCALYLIAWICAKSAICANITTRYKKASLQECDNTRHQENPKCYLLLCMAQTHALTYATPPTSFICLSYIYLFFSFLFSLLYIGLLSSYIFEFLLLRFLYSFSSANSQ